MRRNRLLLLLALALVGAFLFVLRPGTPTPTIPEQRLRPPVVKPRDSRPARAHRILLQLPKGASPNGTCCVSCRTPDIRGDPCFHGDQGRSSACRSHRITGGRRHCAARGT